MKLSSSERWDFGITSEFSEHEFIVSFTTKYVLHSKMIVVWNNFTNG